MDNSQTSGAQFRPVAPPPQGQPFMPMAHQQFRPVGQGMPSNIGMPMPAGQNQTVQYSQQMQQMPPWPNHPGHVTASSQPVSMPYIHPNRPLPQLQQNAAPFAPSSFSQLQTNAIPSSQFQPLPQMHAPVVPAGGQPWLPSGSNGVSASTPVQPAGPQPSASSSTDTAVNVPSQQSSSDWQEHTASDGRRYYYNKRTKQSSWEKPFELMTPIERADASTVWKEFTTSEGKKYYYNKITKQSKWSIPDELRLAREQAQQAANQGTQSEANATSVSVIVTLGDASTTTIPVNSNSSSTSGVVSSPIPVTPVVAVSNPAVVVPNSSALPVTQSTVAMTLLPSAGSTNVAAAVVNANASSWGRFDNLPSGGVVTSADGVSVKNAEEIRTGTEGASKNDSNSSEEKNVDDEPLVFASKLEAKNAFKALLESVNVQSDWTWEQTMREIINDKRYGALKTPGERKQAFNEYLGQRRKIEGEERRMRQKRAREEFTKMLEESKELTSSMKWSKAISLFENDERFKAVEKARDREDLFDNYIVELERKEKEKAAEEHRRNITEFKKFLESCDFVKVNSQWRKVQDRLEDDERCLRLEKLDRLLVFQDYIRDLEKEEEGQKKIQKEQLRRAERKNRDAFRKLLEDHVADGSLTAKTHWLDYCLKVKDLPQYHAVATNTSGSTPKDLFEDVAEELEKQYREDKTCVKEAVKSGKINMTSTMTFEDFKAAISNDVTSSPISDINLKLLYDELLERAKEKEEKEAKKRQRLADEFTQLLYTYKEITTSSSWEDCRPLFEETDEYRAIGEESTSKEIFEDFVAHLQEKAKEKERKREEEKAKKEKEKEEKDKRKEKERKEKEKEREREKGKGTKKDETDSENVDASDSYGHREDRKREKEKDRKHRKRHQSGTDDVSSDKDDKEESKKSRRHGGDRKKSRKRSYTPESDGESRHKKHKRDQRDGSRRNGGYDDLEDGELGEDGEIN